MEVKMINRGDSQRWNHYVLNHKDSIAWHSYEWSDVVKKHYALEFLPLIAEENDEIRGLLPLYRLQNGNLISVPYAVAGGMLSDNSEAEKALFEKAEALTEGKSGQTITFKQYKVPLSLPLKEDGGYYNRELDLTEDIQEIYGNFKEKNKKQIALTDSEDYRFVYPADHLEEYYEILLKHNRRHGLPSVSYQWLEDLVGQKWYKPAFLIKDSQIQAATLVKEFKKTASFPLSCHRARCEKQMYRLYWELIKHLKERDFEIFHSGRIPQTDKTDDYRLGWGGVKYEYHYQYYPPGQEKTETQLKNNIKVRLFKTLWKRMPLSLVRKLGPGITGRFP